MVNKLLFQIYAVNAGIFVHTDSQETPCFNSDGSVGAADCSCNHIIEEMKEYLCAAQRYNMVVFFVLWNGAAWNNDVSTNAGYLLNNAFSVLTTVPRCSFSQT